MPILNTFLEALWKVIWKGDGTICQWPPGSNCDLQFVRDKNNIFLAVTNEDGDEIKKYHVKLEEVK